MLALLLVVSAHALPTPQSALAVFASKSALKDAVVAYLAELPHVHLEWIRRRHAVTEVNDMSGMSNGPVFPSAFNPPSILTKTSPRGT